MGQTLHLLFIFIIFTMQDKYCTNLTINGKNIDGVLETQTQGGRMVGADESTELCRHPINCLSRYLNHSTSTLLCSSCSDKTNNELLECTYFCASFCINYISFARGNSKQRLCGFVCAFHPEAPGSHPKHTPSRYSLLAELKI